MTTHRYRVREANHCLGTASYRGDFATIEEAKAFAEREAKNCRSFVSFEVRDEHDKPVAPPVRGTD